MNAIGTQYIPGIIYLGGGRFLSHKNILSVHDGGGDAVTNCRTSRLSEREHVHCIADLSRSRLRIEICFTRKVSTLL